MVVGFLKRIFGGEPPGAAPAAPVPPGVAPAAPVPPGVASAAPVPPGVASAAPAPPGVAPTPVPPAGKGQPSLVPFVTYVVQALVDNPQDVVVETVEADQLTTLRVSCRKCDVGKIIGKSGKTIAAIRALVNGAAGRLGKRVNVEILD